MKLRKIVGNTDGQLLGDKFTNDTSGMFKSLTNFKLDTNFTGKINTKYDSVLSAFSNPITLKDLNLTIEESEKIQIDKSIKLNIDRSDSKSDIRFGSATDYVKSAIQNILLEYPGSLYINNLNEDTNVVVSDYTVNQYNNTSNFKINDEFIENKFGIIYLKDDLNIIEEYELRNLNLSFEKYVIYIDNEEYNIRSFIGLDNDVVELEVEGFPFGNVSLNAFSGSFHIKPKPQIFNLFKNNLNSLEKYFLSKRDNSNGFKFIIKNIKIFDSGDIQYSDEELTWGTNDGYNLDYDNQSFNVFLEKLIDITNSYDEYKTDVIYRMLIPSSLKLYDTTEDEKIKKLTRIWGRNFDEVRQYIDAIARINKLSYDKKDNIPDVLVKNFARVLGWDNFSLVDDDTIASNLFSVNQEIDNDTTLPSEIDIELWRRILINTNWFWKTKGTRESITAMFRLVGIPESFISIKEHIYLVDDKISINDNEFEISDFKSMSFPFDEYGYPKTPTETDEFFFQTKGDTDGGVEYLNNFRDAGFNLNRIVDNKKSWVYGNNVEREHGTTIKYYQKSSDLVINTKEVDISLDIANAIEYDVYDYIKNIDIPNNSSSFVKSYNFLNINTEDFEYIHLMYEPIGDVQLIINGLVADNDYFDVVDKRIIINDPTFSFEIDDIVMVSYLYEKDNQVNNIEYKIIKVAANIEGDRINLPEEPSGDIQLVVNGITYASNSDTYEGDYFIYPVYDRKELHIINEDLKELLIDNSTIIVSYITSDSNININQKSEAIEVIGFNTDKLYYEASINRYLYRLDYKISKTSDIKITLNGIILKPDTEYQLLTSNKYLILLPNDISIGDVLNFIYITSDEDFDITVSDEFGVGDISELSFLEFVDLLLRKMVNAKNRKTITDNKGGFYPTLLKVYIQYLNRSNLDEGNSLKSNGYDFDDLYNFLSKYNSFFYKFTEQLLPATMIHGESGFLIKNTSFIPQKFKYMRGVGMNIDNNIGIPNSALQWLGCDGSMFKVIQDVDLEEFKILTIKNNERLFVEITYDNEYFATTEYITTFTIKANTEVEILTSPFNNRVFKNYIVNGNNVTTNPLIMIMNDNINIDCISGYLLGFTVVNNDELSITVEYDNIVDTFNNNTKTYNNIMNGTSIEVTCNDIGEFDKWILNGNDIMSNPHTLILNEARTITCIAKEEVANEYIFNINTNLGDDTSFALPLVSGYNYDFIVDWGDGNTNHITKWNDVNKNNTYSTDGEYIITLMGVVEAFNQFNGNENKITSVVFNNEGEFAFQNEMFRDCINLTSFITSNGEWCRDIGLLGRMFSGCSSLANIDTSNWNLENTVALSYIFYGCSSLTTLNVSNWNVNNVITMAGMFYGCSSLTTLDVSEWNTQSVTSMGYMFTGCSSLTTLDVSEWNTQSVTNMQSMFNGCSSLTTLDVSNWNTQSVTNMSYIFYNCSSLTTLDVSEWNTQSVTNMQSMFNGCSSLTTLNVSNLGTFLP